MVTNPATGQPILNNGQPIPSTVAMIPKEAFEFDVHNVYDGLVTLTEPIFMGCKIKAVNDIAGYAEKLAVSQTNTAEKEIIYQTDEAYWQVVSLVHKRKLAESYTALLDTLNRHVQEMIAEGVATQSDGLTVAVKLNAAQITLAKVDNGLALSRMALSQICGLPVNSIFTLEDESLERVAPQETPLSYNMEEVFKNRNEVLSLNYAAKIYEKKKNLALSDMLPGLVLLLVVPIPEAMAYVLLRPLLDNVPDDELCGVAPGKVLPVSEKWHPLLMKALTSIPAITAGDSVWWHCDVIHCVAPVDNQQGWGNVMYIPAAPMCEKNRVYAHKVRKALEKGASPGDFPREDYETNWQGRFTLEDLNVHGKRALGMDV